MSCPLGVSGLRLGWGRGSGVQVPVETDLGSPVPGTRRGRTPTRAGPGSARSQKVDPTDGDDSCDHLGDDHGQEEGHVPRFEGDLRAPHDREEDEERYRRDEPSHRREVDRRKLGHHAFRDERHLPDQAQDEKARVGRDALDVQRPLSAVRCLGPPSRLRAGTSCALFPARIRPGSRPSL